MQWLSRGLLLVLFASCLLVSISGHQLKKAKHAQEETRRPVDLSLYHSTMQIYQRLKHIAAKCPHLQLLPRQGKSKELLSISIKRQDGKKEKKPLKVLMFFGEHARELISPETAVRFVEMLCGLNDRGLHPAPDADTQKLIASVLRDSEVLLFPLINAEGHERASRGGYCFRTNKKGVDLNRNWDDHWVRMKQGDTASGSAAFSEEETQILRDAAHQFQPDMFVSIHSGALGMYTPYAYSEETPKSKSETEMVSILKKLNPDYCNCDVGAAGAQLHYLCPGTCLDYMYDKLNTPYSFAVEIFDGHEGYKRKSSSLLEQGSKVRIHSSLRKKAKKQDAKNDSQSQSCFLVKSETTTTTKTKTKAKSKTKTKSYGNTKNHDHSRDHLFDNSKTLYPQPHNHETYSCLTQFNPVNREEYIATTDNWSRALLQLIEKVREHHHE